MERRAATQSSAPEPQPLGLGLALTLCARLCHDLAGTVGALAGSLDIAASDHDPEALALALDCARELSARLRVLRTAWGNGDEAPGPAALAAGLPGAERLTLDMDGAAPDMDEALRRLLPNLLMIAAEGLPRGGLIHVTGSGSRLDLHIEGARAGWPASFVECLEDPGRLHSAATSARHVGMAVACLLAGELGLRITLHSGTELTATGV